MISRKEHIIPLLVILVIGALLRLYGLGEESLWNDELETVRQASYPGYSEVVELGVRPDVHPPGHVLLTSWFCRIAGNSEFALRLPSAIAGIISIILLYVLGSKIFNARVGLFSAAFMAVLWFPIHYSQEARPYAWIMLFGIASTICLFGFWSREEQNRPPGLLLSALFVLLSVAGIYFHYFYLIFLALQVGILFLAALPDRRRTIHVLVMAALILVAYLPWGRELLADSQREGFWIQKPDILFLWNWFRRAFIYNPVVTLIVLTVMFGGIAVGALRKPAKAKDLIRKPVVILLILLFGPFLIAFIKSLIGTPVLTYKNLILSAPAAYLLFAYSIDVLAPKKIIAPITALAFCGLFSAWLLFAKQYYRVPEKDQFRELSHWAIDKVKEVEDPLIVGHAWFPDYFNYYFDQAGEDLSVDLMAGKNEDGENVDRLVREKGARHLILLRGRLELEADFRSHLARNYEQIAHQGFVEAEGFLFRVP